MSTLMKLRENTYVFDFFARRLLLIKKKILKLKDHGYSREDEPTESRLELISYQ